MVIRTLATEYLTTSMKEQPMSDRTLGRFRARCLEYEAKTGIDLIHDED